MKAAQASKILPQSNQGDESLKLREDADRSNLRKREHKALMKSLKMAQMSTASMGKFDKKRKNEPDAPNSQKIQKKKSTSALGALQHDRKGEKDRNMKIFEVLQKKKEVDAGSKTKAHISEVKMVKKTARKDQRLRRKN